MVQAALQLAQGAGVRFRFISAEDFAEHNTKMMLAFLFAVALRYNVRGLASTPRPETTTAAAGAGSSTSE
jgi:hypothetical protein